MRHESDHSNLRSSLIAGEAVPLAVDVSCLKKSLKIFPFKPTDPLDTVGIAAITGEMKKAGVKAKPLCVSLVRSRRSSLRSGPEECNKAEGCYVANGRRHPRKRPISLEHSVSERYPITLVSAARETVLSRAFDSISDKPSSIPCQRVFQLPLPPISLHCHCLAAVTSI